MCVCVCLQKGFAAAEQNQDYWVNGQDDCRLLYVSASVTAAAPSGLDNDYRACLRHKGGVIAASFVWSICPLINIVISCFFFLFRCSDSLQLRWTNGVSLCDTHPFGVHTYCMSWQKTQTHYCSCCSRSLVLLFHVSGPVFLYYQSCCSTLVVLFLPCSYTF